MSKQCVIVLADDDQMDQRLLKKALDKVSDKNEVQLITVEDGDQLMAYLHRRGDYEGSDGPDLVLLDLNMPVKDGFECLTEIRQAPSLRHIPVVVWSTSEAVEDIYQSYAAGANSFLVKPSDFSSLNAVIRGIVDFWFGLASLPSRRT